MSARRGIDCIEWRNDCGQLHRLDGPARIWSDGRKSWWINGQRHRLDGPAIEGPEINTWYFNNKYIDCDSQQEFERLIKLKAFW